MNKKLEYLEKVDWQFKSQGFKYSTHSLHPYFAKFHPFIPRILIEKFTQPNDIVLDPFLGCGTTLVESMLNGRNGIGVDANPLACLISEVKTSFLDEDEILFIENFRKKITKIYKNGIDRNLLKNVDREVPKIPNIDRWFEKHIIQELNLLFNLIELHKYSQKCYALLNLAASRIIVRVSNQSGESRYTAVKKSLPSLIVFIEFNKALEFTIRRVEEFSRLTKGRVESKIILGDSRQIKATQIPSAHVDLIVTSPPYLNSWDYALYHKFRFYWLGYNVKEFEDKEIGKHLRVREGSNSKGIDEVHRFAIDMNDCFANFGRILKHGKFAFIVNSCSVVNKNFVDTNKIIIDSAKINGFKHIRNFSRTVMGPHYGLKASLVTKNIINDSVRGKEEVIIALKKD